MIIIVLNEGKKCKKNIPRPPVKNLEILDLRLGKWAASFLKVIGDFVKRESENSPDVTDQRSKTKIFNLLRYTPLISSLIWLVSCACPPEQAVNPGLCNGTKKAYEIKGIWYTPQQSYDYDETGIASWYGARFHGHPKSCGEPFNMNGISAAHKTLPIPSVVRVTNPQTGKNVKLLIDDRGPFVENRIIDLSKGAALYLGIYQRGLGEVRVECLPDESKVFADYVTRFGRYGRDPSGKTWEMIFRNKFDQDIAPPKPISSFSPKQRYSKPSPGKVTSVHYAKKTSFKPFLKHSAKNQKKGRHSRDEFDQLAHEGDD